MKRELEDFSTIGVVTELPAGAWRNLSRCFDPHGDCDEACLCVDQGPGCFVKLDVGGLFVTPAPAILLESSVTTIVQEYGVTTGQPDGDGPDAIDWHSMTEERVDHPPIRRVVFARHNATGKLCAADSFEGYQRTITAGEWDAMRSGSTMEQDPFEDLGRSLWGHIFDVDEDDTDGHFYPHSEESWEDRHPKPIRDFIQMDAWAHYGYGDDVMQPDHDGDVLMWTTQQEGQRSGTTVRIWVAADADRDDVLRVLRKQIAWLEQDFRPPRKPRDVSPDNSPPPF